MRKLRTRYFKIALYSSMAFSALFLAWFFLFGQEIAATDFASMTGAVFSVLALATAAFLAICFFPYFRGDKRWYSIPALLTLVFFIGTAILFRVPGTAVIL